MLGNWEEKTSMDEVAQDQQQEESQETRVFNTRRVHRTIQFPSAFESST